jgi:hypothetical protein
MDASQETGNGSTPSLQQGTEPAASGNTVDSRTSETLLIQGSVSPGLQTTPFGGEMTEERMQEARERLRDQFGGGGFGGRGGRSARCIPRQWRIWWWRPRRRFGGGPGGLAAEEEVLVVRAEDLAGLEQPPPRSFFENLRDSVFDASVFIFRTRADKAFLHSK